MSLKVYNVILHRTEDLDAFYADMESPGGNLYIPNRAVEYAARLPFSRVTPYRLTEEEVELLKNDPRVHTVEPSLDEHNIGPEPVWTQSGNWSKSLGAINNTYRNWALYQCTAADDPNWGENGASTLVSSSVTVNAEGLDVDVIVVDGTPNLDHPEFAVNADGTGGSRIIQYNWFQHTDSVTGGLYSNGTWDYDICSLGDSSNNNHGAHVMGTIVGNTQGWARKANVYTISPYSSNYNWKTSGVSSSYVLDYVRAFHRNKGTNPKTGRKNPTIINNSWGYNYGVTGEFPWANGDSDIEKIVYRGTTYNAPFTSEQIYNYAVPAWWSLTRAYRDFGFDVNTVAGIPDAYTSNVPWFFQSVATKTQECIDDGIIVVSAAGNNSSYIDSANGPDYNNHVILRNKRFGSLRAAYQNGDSAVYYNRGAAPGNSSICVGNASIYENNQRDFSSNFGPRTDIFAPGNEIISAIRFNGIYDKDTTDARSGSHYIGQISGTSMASPQVTGVLACMLQNYPDMKQAEALAYLQNNSFKNIMFDSALDWGDVTSWSYPALNAITTDLKNTVNYYLRYKEERQVTGPTVPKLNFKERPTTGVTWPRLKIAKTRRSTGDILYPSAGSNPEAPPESLLTYVGDFGISYVSVDTYIDSASGLDYSPSYAPAGYVGDFLASYTGDYLGSYLSTYAGGVGSSFEGTPYEGSYDAETGGGTTFVEYLGTYIQGEASYTGNFTSDYSTYTGDFVSNYDVLVYTGPVVTYGSYVQNTGSYSPGNQLGYVGAYSAIDSGGGGEIFLATYIGTYVPTYTDAGVSSYLASYDAADTTTYTGNFTVEYNA